MSNAPPYQTEERNEESSWKLISQGAEARIWYIPSFISSTMNTATKSDGNSTKKTQVTSLPAVCKERFSKKYRHATLDTTILKSRTKSEVKCMVRCRRGGVSCPAVLACDMGPKNHLSNNTGDNVRRSSMCLFLEFIPGTTVRECLEQICSANLEDIQQDQSMNTAKSVERSPPLKKFKNDEEKNDTDIAIANHDDAIQKIGNAIGTIISKMHNVNVVHGDLTTSNIMLRNPETSISSKIKTWEPNLVLIDFGLAGTAGAKGVNHEEKAVDLYVLERAIDSTHPSCSALLQKAIFRAYKKHCHTSDSVLQRLSQVRLRGRKRECFG